MSHKNKPNRKAAQFRRILPSYYFYRKQQVKFLNDFPFNDQQLDLFALFLFR